MNKKYYTYAYLREDGTPYYIGKGSGYRINRLDGRPCPTPKDKSRIIFLKQNLTEEEAFKHEIYMISVFGRKDLGTGILYNRSIGGDGASGFIHSQEAREKIRKSKIGKNNPFYNKTHTQEAREKISIANKNKVISQETREKLTGENNSTSMWWKITFENGNEFITCGFYRWANENGYDPSHIHKVYKGKYKKHKDIISVEKISPINKGLESFVAATGMRGFLDK